MSDLAKKVADDFRADASVQGDALAAFIEAARGCRDRISFAKPEPECDCPSCMAALAYDAALRALADAMEVE